MLSNFDDVMCILPVSLCVDSCALSCLDIASAQSEQFKQVSSLNLFGGEGGLGWGTEMMIFSSTPPPSPPPQLAVFLCLHFWNVTKHLMINFVASIQTVVSDSRW